MDIDGVKLNGIK